MPRGAREAQVEVHWTAHGGREERKVHRRLREIGQLDLRLLCGLTETLERHLVLAHVDPARLEELGDHPVHDDVVDVVAAEVRVTVRRDDLHDVVTDLEDRDVERSAAEVVGRDDLVLLLVETARQRRRGGLV